MDFNKPTVSYIMPIYNSEKYILKAVYSVLNQTYSNIELILIDDCPKDLTISRISTIHDERILLLHNDENKGIAYSRNKGLEYATGKYVIFMDHDDISLPDRTELQVEFLEQHPEIDYVAGRVRKIDEEDRVIREWNEAFHNPMYIKARFLFGNIYVNGEVMARRNVISEHSICFSENQYGMEDFKFWIECSKVGKFYTLDEFVYHHRMHSGSETSKNLSLYNEQRQHHHIELSKYSMQLSNILISNEMMQVISNFSEREICETANELMNYYNALREVVRQVRFNQSDFQKEVDIVCRQYLMRQVRRAEALWEL